MKHKALLLAGAGLLFAACAQDAAPPGSVLSARVGLSGITHNYDGSEAKWRELLDGARQANATFQHLQAPPWSYAESSPRVLDLSRGNRRSGSGGRQHRQRRADHARTGSNEHRMNFCHGRSGNGGGTSGARVASTRDPASVCKTGKVPPSRSVDWIKGGPRARPGVTAFHERRVAKGVG